MPDIDGDFQMIDDDNYGVKSLDSSDASPQEKEEDEDEGLLATDIEMIKARVLPNMGDEAETDYETHFIWEIKDWKGLAKRATSEYHVAHGVKWRLLLFPQGNNSGDNISLYLEASPYGEGPHSPDWAVCAQFGLIMWNPSNPQILHMQQAHHRYDTEDGGDWGFSRFYDLRRLAARHLDTQHAILEKNVVNITAVIRTLKDPTGVLWHNFVQYDSKRVTGYVGLRNQGATCYLNSLIQSLYFTNAFRKAVFGIPTHDGSPASRVPLQLQRLFYLLQTSNEPVSTLALTQAFGWDSGDAFTQHDVQELERVLMDSLEGSMKGTAVEGALAELFVGQMKSFIRCVNVPYESSRLEDFWDIQLNVKGMKTLEASFCDYIQVEMLDGENQYQAEGYGLQNAQKGVVFQNFPPVLHLQLKRYEYDFERDTMTKINERYEYPDSIDLSPYLESPNDENWEYSLHGVLVHSGDLNGGHYYGLLKPTENSSWFKFDDDRVTMAFEKEVFEDNFGGDTLLGKTLTLRQQRILRYKRHTSAYMLVYIRKTHIAKVLSPVSESDVPPHIALQLKAEAEAEEQRQREIQVQHLYMPVRVSSIKQFREFHLLDTASWMGSEEESSEPSTIRALKTWTLFDLEKAIQSSLDFSAIRLWSCVKRKNSTIRPDSIIVPKSQNETLEEIRMRLTPSHIELKVFAEEIDESNPFQPSPTSSLIFLKHFDPITQTLTGVDSMHVESSSLVSVIIPSINRTMGWPYNTPLRLYEEIKPRMIDIVQPSKTFEEAEIQNGDIITFQRTDLVIPETARCSNAQEYYDFLNNRIRLLFIRRGAEDPEEGSHTFWVSKKDSYDSLVSALGLAINVPSTHLRLFTTSSDGTPRTPIRRNSGTVADIFQNYYINTYSIMLVYDILDMSLEDLETKRSLTLIYLRNGLAHEEKYPVLVPQTSTVRDIIEILKTKANLSEPPEAFKLWSLQNGRSILHHLLNDSLINLHDDINIYVQLFTDEEQLLVCDEDQSNNSRVKWIQCFHFQKDPMRTHSIPFSFVILADEPFKDTRQRLRSVLGYSDTIFDKIKFSLIRDDNYGTPIYIGEDDELFTHLQNDEHFQLGLDHFDKTPYKRGYGKRAIFIKN